MRSDRRRPAGKAPDDGKEKTLARVEAAAVRPTSDVARAEATSAIHAQAWAAAQGRLEDRHVLTREREVSTDRATVSVAPAIDPLGQPAALLAVAHDLKEPLRSISSLAEIALEDLEHHDETRTREDLARIRAATTRMRALIEFVLHRPPSGWRWESINLRDLLAEVSESLGQPMNRPDSRIWVEEPLGAVLGDRRTLHSLVANIISNGLRHNQNRDARVLVRRINRRYASEVIFEDNGPGFPGNPYEQGIGERKDLQRMHGGEIVGQAVARLRGKLWIERRNPPPGTVVHVLLPPS